VPDPSKLDALKAAGYVIRACCGLCQHATLKPGTDWGTCSLVSYQHGKHTEIRQASIHRAGHCPKYTGDVDKNADLAKSGFINFTR